MDKSLSLSTKIQPPNILIEDKKAALAAAAASNGNHQQSAQDEKQARGSALRQVLAAFVAQLGTINTGMVFGFSAIAIPQLRLETSPIKIGVNEESWIGKKTSLLHFSISNSRTRIFSSVFQNGNEPIQKKMSRQKIHNSFAKKMEGMKTLVDKIDR